MQLSEWGTRDSGTVGGTLCLNVTRLGGGPLIDSWDFKRAG